MMEKKLCPVLLAGLYAGDNEDKYTDTAADCHALCAWWLDDGCIKIAEVKELYRLRQAVEKLADVVRNHA